jgi:hypothetical protein
LNSTKARCTDEQEDCNLLFEFDMPTVLYLAVSLQSMDQSTKDMFLNTERPVNTQVMTAEKLANPCSTRES